eukprot:CAMPEP_0184698350 /NCGR_PEP_ID=MMETSP0313-20130426/5005_1 /TAXON_ID=2792 /ORGANISM="Porphyridium aerugineum, Strain SAG 1380-2" /LENGTH=391 /DNA_ID=CAMNT_0027157279 /DNA_START=110 /DNA_END=1285 /DNA_ORIENTATION=-
MNGMGKATSHVLDDLRSMTSKTKIAFTHLASAGSADGRGPTPVNSERDKSSGSVEDDDAPAGRDKPPSFSEQMKGMKTKAQTGLLSPRKANTNAGLLSPRKKPAGQTGLCSPKTSSLVPGTLSPKRSSIVSKLTSYEVSALIEPYERIQPEEEAIQQDESGENIISHRSTRLPRNEGLPFVVEPLEFDFEADPAPAPGVDVFPCVEFEGDDMLAILSNPVASASPFTLNRNGSWGLLDYLESSGMANASQYCSESRIVLQGKMNRLPASTSKRKLGSSKSMAKVLSAQEPTSSFSSIGMSTRQVDREDTRETARQLVGKFRTNRDLVNAVEKDMSVAKSPLVSRPMPMGKASNWGIVTNVPRRLATIRDEDETEKSENSSAAVSPFSEAPF